ncbi:metal-dependent hydrolase [Vagococcus sp.]|uniref:metal-dependent hydrolase n=1 Tax=Vagococcus sp. TaxID=1933889 RepID=UPI003F9D3467
MKLSYHGHSIISIETNNGVRLMFDPFITGNELTDLKLSEVETDYLLITHGHNDHVGDMLPIAKKTGATVIAIPEIIHFATKNGVENVHPMNIGGTYSFPFGRVKMVHAQHSSGYELGDEMIYMGSPAGFILEIEGQTIYHAGDTSEFGDMGLLGELFGIDIAFLPIGDNFTMGPEEAVRASQRLKAKKVIPIHYNTFPVIQQEPMDFINLLPNGVGQVLAIGETIEL